MTPGAIRVERHLLRPLDTANPSLSIVPSDAKTPRLARHGGAERAEDPRLLPTLLAGLEGVVRSRMGARHARAALPHLGRHRARFCEVQGAHQLGKMAGDPRKRAESARARQPINFMSGPID